MQLPKLQIFAYFFCLLFIVSCSDNKAVSNYASEHVLSLENAERFIALPLTCTEQEYPNKLGQVLISDDDLKAPKDLHPAFYGCFDWHSAVHGHWVLARLLRSYPNINQAKEAKRILTKHLAKENIQGELAYFNQKESYSYERTYGWAWLLKLQAELHMNKEDWAQELSKNLQPLSDVLVHRYNAYTPKLMHPVRVGTHTSTAFGLSLAWDYADEMKDEVFKEFIKEQAHRLFANDLHCQLQYEPSGTDFLSPCFEEAFLMSKVMPNADYEPWLANFLPSLANPKFRLAYAEVSDRTDGHLVHQDGLNFSRAWCLRGIGKKLPQTYSHLLPIADEQIGYSLPNLVGDAYEGGHWLASFAILSLEQ